MEEAYNKASGGLPANARQIMYAARPYIQETVGKRLGDNYFTQVSLPNYIKEHGVAWNVIYDARGHFTEPHDEAETFGVGTAEVRTYLANLHDPDIMDAKFENAKVATKGPDGRFGAVLSSEKEGFDQVLEAANIAEKYDIAIMSTKGCRHRGAGTG
jgi:hypothetical protein